MQVFESLLFVVLAFGILSFVPVSASFLRAFSLVIPILMATSIVSIFFIESKNFVFGGFNAIHGIEHSIDGFSSVIAVMILLAGFYTITTAYIEKRISSNFVGFSTVATVCGVFIAITRDIFNFYVFLELITICMILIFSNTQNKTIKQNTLEYLLLGGVAAGFLVLGIEIIYIIFKTLNVSAIAKIAPEIQGNAKKLLQIAVVFILTSSVIKLGVFPASSWVRKIYTSVPNGFLVFYGCIGSIVAVYIPIFFFYVVLHNVSLIVFVGNIITPFVLMGMVIFSFLAIKERDLRLIMAFSTVTQIGYIYISLTIPNVYAISGSLLHIVHNFVTKFGIFSVIAFLGRGGVYDISALKGFGRNTFAGIAVCIILASIVGIPLTSGFVSKFQMLRGLVEESRFVVLAFFVLTSVLSIIYCWRIACIMYFEKPTKKQEVPLYINIYLLLTVAFVFLLGFAMNFSIGVVQAVAMEYLQSL